MSTLRRLALAGAFALPLSLVIAGPSSAHPLDWPHDSWSAESSATWAGIGGAGTTETEEGSDWWGHHWSETDTAVAGIGGAAVIHGETSGTDEDDWSDDDDWADDETPAVVHHDSHPVAHQESHPATHHPAAHHASHPVAHHPDPEPEAPAADVSYATETQSADMDGATSSHVASHAGDHHAAYEAENLSAGPDGAVSEGVHALAVPQYAAYANWYAAAGDEGAVVHSVSSVADATDDYGYHHHRDSDRG
ncbi:hypothetical protein [Amycolatopsis sp. NPDC049159]|uniref:hypothetical protein n=1 Tax=unclassified Amycolatopsis TaxID=2618356 RepID=UPI0033F63D54